MILLIADALRGDAAVAALVGDRVWPVRRPQGRELPALTLSSVSAVPLQSHDGAGALTRSRLQVDCWASSWAAARALRAAAIGAIEATEDPAGPIPSIARMGDRDLPELREAGEDLFRVSIDFEIWHKEA